MRHWFEQLPIAAPSVQARWATANAVEDGVGKRGFVDDVVSGRDRELAGDQDRASPMAVFDDFHQVATLTSGQAVRTPVVEDEQVGLHQRSEQARKASVAMGKFEIGEQAGQPLADDGEVGAGRLFDPRRRQARSCRHRRGR